MTPDRVFVDTGAWYALQVTDDGHHAAAARSFPDILDRSRALVTTNVVVGETYTLLRISKDYNAAKRFIDRLSQTTRLERFFITEDLERRAYDILHRYRDHPFSFVDATSFAVMRQQRIQYAFAFDSHFATAGFVRIPVDVQRF